jgi:hypothetical protein
LRASDAHRRIAALALSLAGVSLLAGCGGSKVQEQDKDEPSGTFPVRLVSASFPADQRLAKDSKMRIVVENAGTKRVPNINVTVKCPGKGLGGSFMTVTSDSDVADPERPQFIARTRRSTRRRSSARRRSSTPTHSGRSSPTGQPRSCGT